MRHDAKDEGLNGRDSWACNGRGDVELAACRAEGVMESQFRLEEHNEADLESKIIDSTLLLKGEHPFDHQ